MYAKQSYIITKHMIKYCYSKEPENFNKKADIVSVFCEYKWKILSLRRNPERFQGDTRAWPAGKFELNIDKDFKTAAIRELLEETGIDLDKFPKELIYLWKHYLRYPDWFDYEYHKFKLVLDEEPYIILNNREHTDKVRLTPEETLKLNLIWWEDAVIKAYYWIE